MHPSDPSSIAQHLKKTFLPSNRNKGKFSPKTQY